MEAATYIIAMTSLMDDEEGFLRLKKALLSIEKEIQNSKLNLNEIKEWDSKGNSGFVIKNDRLEVNNQEGFKIPKAKRKCSIKKAIRMPQEEVSLKDCVGRISKEYVFVYPPGIPVLTPGEGIRKEIRDLLLKYIDLGLNVKGLYDDKKIKVLCEESEAL